MESEHVEWYVLGTYYFKNAPDWNLNKNKTKNVFPPAVTVRNEM